MSAIRDAFIPRMSLRPECARANLAGQIGRGFPGTCIGPPPRLWRAIRPHAATSCRGFKVEKMRTGIWLWA